LQKNIQPYDKTNFFCFLVYYIRNNFSKCTNHISYSYDSNGNRYNRKVLVLKSAEASDTSQTEEGISLNLDKIVLIAFPNPTMGEIIISANDNIEHGVIHLYDLSGRLILTQLFSGNTASIDLKNQNPGQYLMIIQAGKERKEITIIKE
jgi:hypothetical protein